MTQEYIITAPIYGCASAIVEAESEEEAQQKFADGQVGEWEVDHFEVGSGGCRGNVCYRTEFDKVTFEPN